MYLDAPYIQLSNIEITPLKRQIDANKGTHGSVAIVGGHDDMIGALLLASRTALLCGAGRVYAFSIAQAPLPVDTLFPEVMHRLLSELPQLIDSMDALVIGPGLGKSPTAIKWLEFCLTQPKPILVDADGLNLIAEHPELAALMRDRHHATLLTPHPGEAARLLNQAVPTIQHNRIQAAQAIAKQFNCCCVLKGANSVCANQHGDYWINPTGNPGLASAGTGDVLSGAIGALVAQGMPALYALKLGVYVHGQAADNLVKQGIGPNGLTASEVSIEIRKTLNAITNNHY